MIFKMPKYECKYHDKEGWEDISEIDLLGDLAKSNEGITFAIQQIIDGGRVLTSKAVYRLKLKE